MTARGRLSHRVALVGMTLVGLGLVLGARWVTPQAPPMYEGAFIPPPYQYCSPPDNLKSSNKLPAGGQGDLPLTNGMSKLGTVETDDRQVVAFFAQGVFKLGDGTVHVKVTPLCNGAPPPPPHSTLVGNVYAVEASVSSAGAPASPPPVATPAQLLLRVPPIAYNTVRVYYDGAWHDTQFGAQIDIVNVSLDHLGDVAAFNDTSLRVKAKPPPGFNFATIFEAVLTVIAVLIIGAGIIAQRRRTQALKNSK